LKASLRFALVIGAFQNKAHRLLRRFRGKIKEVKAKQAYSKSEKLERQKAKGLASASFAPF
jgi:hypothetical protein